MGFTFTTLRSMHTCMPNGINIYSTSGNEIHVYPIWLPW